MDEWNSLAGELRSTLTARNWRQAGAVVWQLRQIDEALYTDQFKQFTKDQMNIGGYPMSLDTEQRLEALHAKLEMIEEDPKTWAMLASLARGGVFPSPNEQPPTPPNLSDVLHWTFVAFDMHQHPVTHWVLSRDQCDVIWSFLQSKEGVDWEAFARD